MINQRLDPLRFPLHGTRFIEASAGTGKTFTIALLYVRLILQHGDIIRNTRLLFPPDILVLTFTNAATDELRTRIRQRLVETAAVLRDPQQSADAELLQLRAELQSTGNTDLIHYAHRLEYAATWMDEAAITTIHKWCQRMLQEYALAGGRVFEEQLQLENNTLIQRATEDYWRLFCLPLPMALLQEIHSYWQDTDALRRAVRELLPYSEALPFTAQPLTLHELLPQCHQEYRAALQRIKTTWRQDRLIEQLADLFAAADKQNAFNRNRAARNYRQNVLDQLQQWRDDDHCEYPAFINTDSQTWRRMSALAIHEIWYKPEDAPHDHPSCQALAQLPEQLNALSTARPAVLIHATQWIQAHIAREQSQRGELGPQDLLVRLDAALQSEHGPQLAAAIRRQFPVALIDECQDTDPVQYRIFNAVYAPTQLTGTTALVLIGDPKQAIYAFRGADVYAYLMARDAANSQRYTLGVNYRSSADLIARINALLIDGEQHTLRGTFGFRGQFHSDNPLPYAPVAPSPHAEQAGLWIDQQLQSPLAAWVLDNDSAIPDEYITAIKKSGEIKKELYQLAMAQATARTIAHLLQLGQTNRAQLATVVMKGARRAVQANDIAILVNKHDEATIVRRELRRLGIASVYLSERQRVFATATARQLLVILRAVANPFEEALLRQALATALLHLTLAELERLNQDEAYWEMQFERFYHYHDIWHQRGLLPLLYQFITDFAVAAHLLITPDGERILTDLLHLGELLHIASQTLDGMPAMIRHLETLVNAPDEHHSNTSDAQQVRLESDAQLVKITTIHKAKGLEYPLVFIPFAVQCKSIDHKTLPIKTHAESYQLQVHVTATSALIQQADHERLSEDVRKLYVALTRAQVAVWLGIGGIATVPQSALGYLLGLQCGSIRTQLQNRQSPFTVIELPPAPTVNWQPPPAEALAPARRGSVAHLPRWWITSYSALHYSAQPQVTPAATTATQETALEESGVATNMTVIAPNVTPTTADVSATQLHTLPRGSGVGTFLHGILEWAAAQTTRSATGTVLHGYAAAAAAPALCHALLTQRCTLHGLTAWVDPLSAWLAQFLQRPWSLSALSVNDQIPTIQLTALHPHQLQVEMEFWLETTDVAVAQLDRIVQTAILPNQPRPALEPQRLHGMLKGFIDVVFEHAERWYIVDWKSNWLGPNDAAYSAAAMTNAVLQARYDLQYTLYTLALHRLLRWRQPDYHYERHFGGVIYVFLRGSDSVTHGLFMDRPPRQCIEQLDSLFYHATAVSPC